MIFKNDELCYILNKHFAQYDKMVRETKVNDIYDSWTAWCNDVASGHMGGKRCYKNCDQLVYDWCMERHYLVMTN